RLGGPLAVGGFMPLEKVYSFEPVPPELTAAEAERILGAQCQLWSEYIPTPQHFEYMAFPRITALSEVVWTPATRKDYSTFQTRLAIHERRMRALGVAGRWPVAPRTVRSDFAPWAL